MATQFEFKRCQYKVDCEQSRQYYCGFINVFDEVPDNFFRYGKEQLVGAEIFSIYDSSNALAAALVSQKDDEGILNFKAAYTLPKHRGQGLMTALIESSLHLCFQRGVTFAIAHIRVFEDNSYNVASQKAFMKASFKPEGYVTVQLSGDKYDQHLLEGANEFGIIRGRKLVAHRPEYFC